MIEAGLLARFSVTDNTATLMPDPITSDPAYSFPNFPLSSPSSFGVTFENQNYAQIPEPTVFGFVVPGGAALASRRRARNGTVG